jgi:hypothetical protein
MEFQSTFTTTIPAATARERIAAFLVQAGYKQLPGADGGLYFKRGSTWGTLSSFNPMKWACAATINIKSEGTSSQINTTAEISSDPTEKHFAEELLTEEFGLLEAAVTTNVFNIFDVSDLKKKIAGHVSRIVLVSAALMISAVIGVIAGAFASFSLNIHLIGSTAIGIGFLIITGALFAVILRRQKKT